MPKPTAAHRIAYRATFTRIGRNHTVPPLVTGPVANGNELADLIYDYARPHLMSRCVDVAVDLDGLQGNIFCGFQSGGDFTLEAVTGDA
jgi:hypothetical protein